VSNWFNRLKLQSPFWQGVGAVVSIIALIVSTFIAYDIYQKSLQSPGLSISQEYSFNPIEFGKDSSKPISISIGDEAVSDLKVYSYTLKNTGNLPIRPEDYIKPITITVEKDLRILTIEKSRSDPEGIDVSWNEVGKNEFSLTPLLLNPNDSMSTLVFVSAAEPVGKSSKDNNEAEEILSGKEGLDSESKGSEKESNKSDALERDMQAPSWTGRIVNISDIEVSTYDETYQARVESLGMFYTNFSHSGWSVYRFGIIFLMLFLSGLILERQSSRLRQGSSAYYIVISTLMLLSVVSGDNIASRLNGSGSQPLVSNISLLAYCLLIVFLTFPILKTFWS
jgi:hypothetical protein